MNKRFDDIFKVRNNKSGDVSSCERRDIERDFIKEAK